MPKVIDDEMVRIMPEDKIMIRGIGYAKAARLTGKTDSYMRYMTSRGAKRIRSKDLDRLKEHYATL